MIGTDKTQSENWSTEVVRSCVEGTWNERSSNSAPSHLWKLELKKKRAHKESADSTDSLI